jgi:hypothetical protein
VEGLHDTFYGMREFIIRDLNRFWITFGSPLWLPDPRFVERALNATSVNHQLKGLPR